MIKFFEWFDAWSTNEGIFLSGIAVVLLMIIWERKYERYNKQSNQ